MAFAKWRKLVLEGELGAEPERRRSLDQQRRTIEGVLYRRDSCHTAIDREGLVQSYCALAIEDVEPVSTQSQLFTFTNSDRIVNSQVKIHCRGRSVGTNALNNVGESRLGSRDSRNDCGSTLNGETFVVSIDRMRNQLVERHTGLSVEVSAEQKFPRGAIAAVELELVRPIVRQATVGVGEQALEVEQRSDVRVRLPVVITEKAFVVTDQAREHVRSDELEVIRKSLRGGELDCAVETLSASKALRSATSRRVTTAGIFFSRAGSNAARVEDEVGVAVIE